MRSSAISRRTRRLRGRTPGVVIPKHVPPPAPGRPELHVILSGRVWFSRWKRTQEGCDRADENVRRESGGDGRTRLNTLQRRGSVQMNRATVRPRTRGRAWYRGRSGALPSSISPSGNYDARCERLERDPVEELHNSCGAKVEHLKHLTASLELDGQ